MNNFIQVFSDVYVELDSKNLILKYHVKKKEKYFSEKLANEKNFFKILPEHLVLKYSDAIEAAKDLSKQLIEIEFSFLYKNREHYYESHIVFQNSSGIAQIVIRNISDRKYSEQMSSQSIKLEALGTLAAGFAHEVNTPMQYIRDNLSFIHGELKNIISSLEQR